MEEIKVSDKQKYLEDNYPFAEIPSLKEKKRCIHCNSIFTVEEFKVFKDYFGDEIISCPNAPECDGTAIDWFMIEDNEDSDSLRDGKKIQLIGWIGGGKKEKTITINANDIIVIEEKKGKTIIYTTKEGQFEISTLISRKDIEEMIHPASNE